MTLHPRLYGQSKWNQRIYNSNKRSQEAGGDAEVRAAWEETKERVGSEYDRNTLHGILSELTKF